MYIKILIVGFTTSLEAKYIVIKTLKENWHRSFSPLPSLSHSPPSPTLSLPFPIRDSTVLHTLAVPCTCSGMPFLYLNPQRKKDRLIQAIQGLFWPKNFIENPFECQGIQRLYQTNQKISRYLTIWFRKRVFFEV